MFSLLLGYNAAYPQGNNAVNITIIGSATYSARLADFYSTANEGMLTVVLRNHLTDLTPIEAMEFLQKTIHNTRNNEEYLYTMDK